ncbi:MAG: hypothetical protein ACERKD_00320 [Prolixibacteraceae bacterium]
MSIKRYQYLGYLQIFIGMGALAGGLPMILTPDGSSSGLSAEILNNTPFTTYLIPGILLFTVNGLGNLVASYFSLKFKKETGVLGMIFGTALIIWMIVQLYYLGYASWFQPLYLAVGSVELVLGYFINKEILHPSSKK